MTPKTAPRFSPAGQIYSRGQGALTFDQDFIILGKGIIFLLQSTDSLEHFVIPFGAALFGKRRRYPLQVLFKTMLKLAFHDLFFSGFLKIFCNKGYAPRLVE